MNKAEKNSQAANDWARKKQEQVEKAKRLREERKNGLLKAGEMAVTTSTNVSSLGKF